MSKSREVISLKPIGNVRIEGDNLSEADYFIDIDEQKLNGFLPVAGFLRSLPVISGKQILPSLHHTSAPNCRQTA